MIHPIHFFTQKILPLVYDDSLSYYEVLAKLTSKINEVITNVNDNLADYIRAALPEIFVNAFYDAEDKTINLTGDDTGSLTQTTAAYMQVGSDIIPLEDSSARNAVQTLNQVTANHEKAITRYNKLKNLAGSGIVFFGDSWTTGSGATATNKRFSTLVANALGMVEHNYGVGASGFTRPLAIMSQISAATEGMTAAARSEIPYVVLTGGVNDVRHMEDTDYSSFVSAVSAAVNSIHTAFPNAILVAVIGNTTVSGMSEAWIHWLTSGQEYAQINKTFPIINCRGCENWIRGREAWYASDGLHPNDTGHAMWASFIVNAITGGSNYILDFLSAPTFNENVATVHVTPHFWKENSKMCLSGGRLTLASELTNENLLIGTFPAILAPKENIYAPVYFQNRVRGAIVLTSSGNIYLNAQDPNYPLLNVYIPAFVWMMY